MNGFEPTSTGRPAWLRWGALAVAGLVVVVLVFLAGVAVGHRQQSTVSAGGPTTTATVVQPTTTATTTIPTTIPHDDHDHDDSRHDHRRTFDVPDVPHDHEALADGAAHDAAPTDHDRRDDDRPAHHHDPAGVVPG